MIKNVDMLILTDSQKARLEAFRKGPKASVIGTINSYYAFGNTEELIKVEIIANSVVQAVWYKQKNIETLGEACAKVIESYIVNGYELIGFTSLSIEGTFTKSIKLKFN